MADDSTVAQPAAYLDFDVELGPGADRSYPVAVRSVVGEGRGTLSFPFDAQTLEQHLQAIDMALLRSAVPRRNIGPEQLTVQEFGAALFAALFQGEVRSRYDAILERVRSERKELRLRLHITTPELAWVPWEFLFDADQREYLCLLNVSLVRYLDLQQSVVPLSVVGPLKILGMVANPEGLLPLDVAEEQQRIMAALEPLTTSGRVQLTWLEHGTWRALQDAMLRGPWHIFHFIGHGSFDEASREGLLILEDEQHQAFPLTASELARLLDNQHDLRLVLLNSCDGARGSSHDIFSSTAATLVLRGIPAVLAMQYEISDAAAKELARTFYVTLAAGLPVETAVAQARELISLANRRSVEWGTPVLYLRTADGTLFKVDPAAAREAAAMATRPPDVPAAPASGGLRALRQLKGHSKQVNAVVFSPDGRLLVSASGGWLWQDNTVRVWSVADGTQLDVLRGHRRQVWSVAFAPDGGTFASASLDGTVRVWHAGDRSLMQVLAHDLAVLHVAFAPDGKTLAAALRGRKVQLWRVDDWTKLATIAGHTGAVNMVDWSPDGQTIATASDDRTVRLWSVADGAQLELLTGHSGRVRGVAFSPDGTLLASAGDTTVRVWRVADAAAEQVLVGHEWPVWSARFVPDGRMLVSGSFDATVRLWRVADGAALAVGRGHAKPVQAVAVSPDGALVASASHDCMIRIWERT